MRIALFPQRPKWRPRLALALWDVVLALALAIAYTVIYAVFAPLLNPDDSASLLWLMVASWIAVFILQLVGSMLRERA